MQIPTNIIRNISTGSENRIREEDANVTKYVTKDVKSPNRDMNTIK